MRLLDRSHDIAEAQDKRRENFKGLMSEKNLTQVTVAALEKHRPEVMQEYKDNADGKTLIVFRPDHISADEWGFIVSPLDTVIRPESGNTSELRFLSTQFCYRLFLGNDYLESGSQFGLKNAHKAKEGEVFNSWKSQYHYRLTQKEIDGIVKGKLFTCGTPTMPHSKN